MVNVRLSLQYLDISLIALCVNLILHLQNVGPTCWSLCVGGYKC